MINLTLKEAENKGFKFIKENNSCSLVSYSGEEKEIDIPESIDGIKVTSIGEGAFQLNKNIISINIPEGIIKIENRAFFNCRKILKINIPGTVKFVGEQVFSGCSMLKEISIPEGVEKLEDKTFFQCGSLTSVNLPQSLKYIGISAFEGCNSLEKIKLSDKISEIGASAFSGCRNLTEINIPLNLLFISAFIFSGCKKITEINLPQKINSIGKSAFENCYNLNKINIPEGVKEIKEKTFYECRNLNKIILPETINKIGNYSFFECRNLIEINIPQSVNEIGEGGFSYCSGLTEIILPENLINIGAWAFRDCRRIKNITLSSDFKSVGYGSFSFGGSLISGQVNHTKSGNTPFCAFSGKIAPQPETEETYEFNTKINIFLATDEFRRNIEDIFSPEEINSIYAPLMSLAFFRTRELKELAVSGYIYAFSENIELNNKYKSEYDNYIQSDNSIRKFIFSKAIDNEIYMHFISEKKLIDSLEELDELIELAEQNKNPFIMAMLLEYKQNNFTSDEIFDFESNCFDDL